MAKSSPKYWLYPPGFYLSRLCSMSHLDVTIVFLTGQKSGVQYTRRLNGMSTPAFPFTALNWNCVGKYNVEPQIGNGYSSDVEYFKTFEELQAKYANDPLIGPMIQTPPKPVKLKMAEVLDQELKDDYYTEEDE